MILSNFSIKHKTTVLVFGILITFAGLMAYLTLPRESAPDIKIPFVNIFTNYEGASPSDIESLITRPIERKLKTLTDYKEMTSQSSEGFSTITIEFDPNYDIDTALRKVKDKVDEAKGDLPEDLIDDPIVKEVSSSEIFPLLYINISGDIGLPKLKKIAEDLEEDVESIKGVLGADLIGDLEREIRVEFDQDRFSAYNITMADIVGTIKYNNVNTPGGSLDIGEAKYNLKIPAEFESPDEIDNLVVATKGGKPVYINDIATIKDTYKDRDSYSRINSKESIALKVTKRSGENILRIAGEIKELVKKYQEKSPSQVAFSITSDSSEEIKDMVTDLENNIYTGLILVLAVIFLSIGFRNAIIISMAIPFSMLITFFTLQIMGITLNMVVLFSLVLALGMLVDNAIVIVENIYRHHTELGKPLIQACMDGTEEVAWPVISSTLTTVVAFIPLIYWPGIMGEFMGYLPKTVIITLMASLLVALVINPTMAAILIRKPKNFVSSEVDPTKGYELKKKGKFLKLYANFLRFGLRYRFLSILIFMIVLAASIYAFAASGLGIELFPDSEPSFISVSIKAPEGTNVEQSNNFAKTVESIASKYGNIKNITTSVGAGVGEGSSENRAMISIDMVKREERKANGTDGRIYFQNSNKSLEAMRKELTKAIIGAEVKVEKQEMGPPVGKPVNIEISGDNFEILSQIADQIKEKLKVVEGVVDIEDDYNLGMPEIKIRVDKERAALLGLNAFTVGQLIKAAVNGIKIGNYREAEDEYDITARLPENQRMNIQDIIRLRIPDISGNPVPLTSVARIDTTSGLSTIKHIDEKRIVTVSADVAQGFNAQAILKGIKAKAKDFQLPQGYTLSYTGENEEMEESQVFMFKSFIIALLLILLVLVTQFNSIMVPGIIMFSVILSFIGVFLGLIFTATPFGVIMTGMGVISLAGVVVNNAIVLIDYIMILRRNGFSCSDAIVEAGCTRLRPVFLTAITTILGLIPMAIGVSFDFYKLKWIIGSESAQWWGPMAYCVMFGLTVATLLTLFVVPNLFSLVYDFRKRDKGKFEMMNADSQ